MSYFLALILLMVAALLVAMVRSPHRHPRHEFLFEMLARMGPGDVVPGFAPDGKQDHRRYAA